MRARNEGALIGLDVGTTGARAIAIDLQGTVLASAANEYLLSTPHPGWTEQDPEVWWSASQAVIAAVVPALNTPPIALGLTGQMHGSVFLDSADKVIRPALLWNDQRTADQCREITKLVGEETLLRTTGNVAITGFQAPKILWLRDEEPARSRRVRTVLLPKDFIRLQLTGDRATDASDASGTLLLDLQKRDWSAEILNALQIPREWMPRVHEGSETTGTVSSEIAERLGLPPGLPVAAGGGDNAAAAVGNGIIRPGAVSSSIGSSGVVFAFAHAPLTDARGRLQSFCHAFPAAYHVMGVTLSAGASFRWWRDVAGSGRDYEELTRLADGAPAGSEGLIFLPYLAGERTPHLDPNARGAFVGLHLRHTAAHLARAVMEGVVFSLKECLDLVAELGLPVSEIRATGGGARSRLWRQLQADVFGLPVHRNRVDEGPAFGAALLAGVACGAFANVEQTSSVVRVEPDADLPDATAHDLYERQRRTYSKLYKAIAPAMHRLAAIDESG
jgi:xylulokinase